MANPLHFLALLLTGISIVGYIGVSHKVRTIYDRITTSRKFVGPPANGSQYDFIIVGSGSSGSPITRRLAEAGHSVLLVEAGAPSNWFNGVPSAAAYWMDSVYDWQYTTEPSDKASKAMHKHGRVKWPRGKVLGGSSMLNWMIHVRGHSKDYDEWSNLGNPGWSYKEVLPFFKKSQDFVGDVENKEKYHGTGGPLGVMPSAYMHGMSDIYSAAFSELGHPFGDVNGAKEDNGFYSRVQVFLKNGWRIGSFKSYVEPIIDQYDLTVLPHTQATKILFDANDATKAVGIQVKRFGETLNYYATKETIISAGAIGSPQLLMLSGIGPADHLKSLGIEVKNNLPGVGQNLQDHVMVMLGYYTEEATPGLTMSGLAVTNPVNHLKLWVAGGGPLSDNGLGTNGVIRTKVASANDSRPDIQIHTTPFSFAIDYGIGMANIFSISKASYQEMFSKYDSNFTTTMILPTLLRPKSRGNLKLKSADPDEHPVLTSGYLEHPDDVKTLVEGMKFAYSLKDTDTFKQHGLRPMDADTLRCGQFEAFSDEYWECYVRHWTFTVYHQSGTAKMGPDSDPTAVLTPDLKVRGIKGLRVADASIMPTLVGGNTHAPCTMIGERAADFILKDWEEDRSGGAKQAKLKQEL